MPVSNPFASSRATSFSEGIFAINSSHANGHPPNPPAAKSESPERALPRRIPARFRGGVLYLLEDVGLPDGTVVEVSIFPLQKRESS